MAVPLTAFTVLLSAVPVPCLSQSPAQHGSSPAEPLQPEPSAAPAEPPPPPSGGTVLFSRELPSDPAAAPPATGPPGAAQPDVVPNQPDALRVSDTERNALTVTAYVLDVHLTPAKHGLAARVELTVRNDGAAQLTRLVLQISSSLHWEGLSIVRPGEPLERLALVRRRLATDADHTGWASEAVAALPRPLAAGDSLRLAAVYSGEVAVSGERLERLGAPAAEAEAAEWDQVSAPDAAGSPTSTALRGFGNVLWYPVAAPPVFLGDGARLLELAGRTRLREQTATVALRLATEYAGDAPATAFFCGRPQPLVAVRDNPDASAAEATGVATASFPAQPLGFRVPSLFVTDHAPSPAGPASHPDWIAATTEYFDALKSYTAAATQLEPFLVEWFGPHAREPLSLLDHPGPPFEDDALLLRPLRTEDTATLAAALAHSLTHTRIRSVHPWIDEGLPQFMALLWLERTAGRTAAIDRLGEDARTIAFAEPDLSSSASSSAFPSSGRSVGTPDQAGSSSSTPEGPDARRGAGQAPAAGEQPGQPLLSAWSDVFFRTKAGAVWWMLRDLVGDEALRQALAGYSADSRADLDPAGLEHAVERASHQDLRWFFDDWVYHDRGLPDLSVLHVIPRQLEGSGAGRPGGWLVSVEVRNDGDCVADVPVTVRSAAGAKGAGVASETQRLRIPAHDTITRRIVFPVPPAEVQVNDGSVPESRVSVHTEHIGSPAR
ncbi:MAG: hypothetical protein M3O02_08150 [Acidobacteriota bacterium]|nr:hypothetical protein [Acidobacteriota bacterium]